MVANDWAIVPALLPSRSRFWELPLAVAPRKWAP